MTLAKLNGTFLRDQTKGTYHFNTDAFLPSVKKASMKATITVNTPRVGSSSNPIKSNQPDKSKLAFFLQPKPRISGLTATFTPAPTVIKPRTITGQRNLFEAQAQRTQQINLIQERQQQQGSLFSNPTEQKLVNRIRLEQQNKNLANIQQRERFDLITSGNYGQQALGFGFAGAQLTDKGKAILRDPQGVKGFIEKKFTPVKDPTFTFGSTFGSDGRISRQRDSNLSDELIEQRLPASNIKLQREINQREISLGFAESFPNANPVAITPTVIAPAEQSFRNSQVDILPSGQQSPLTIFQRDAFIETGSLPFLSTVPTVSQGRTNRPSPFGVASPLQSSDLPVVATLSPVGVPFVGSPQSQGLVTVSGGEQLGELEPIIFPTAELNRPNSVFGAVTGGFAQGAIGALESYAEPALQVPALFGEQVAPIIRNRELAGPLFVEGIFGATLGVGITGVLNLGQTEDVFNREVGTVFNESVDMLGRGASLVQRDPLFQVPTVIGAGLVEAGTFFIGKGTFQTGKQFFKQTVPQAVKQAQTIPDIIKGKGQGLSVQQAIKKGNIEKQIKVVTKEIRQIDNMQAQYQKTGKLSEIQNKKLGGNQNLSVKDRLAEKREMLVKFKDMKTEKAGQIQPAKIKVKSDLEQSAEGRIGSQSESSLSDGSFGFAQFQGGLDDALEGIVKIPIRKKGVAVKGESGGINILDDSVFAGVKAGDETGLFQVLKQTDIKPTKSGIKPDLTEGRLFGGAPKPKKGKGSGSDKDGFDPFPAGLAGVVGGSLVATQIARESQFLNMVDLGQDGRFTNALVDARSRTKQQEDTSQIFDQTPALALSELLGEKQDQKQKQASSFALGFPTFPRGGLATPQSQIPRLGLLQFVDNPLPVLPSLKFGFQPQGAGGSQGQADKGGDFDFFRVFAVAKQPFGKTAIPLGGFVDSDRPIDEISDVLTTKEIFRENRLTQNPIRAPKNIIDEDVFTDNLFGVLSETPKRKKGRKKSRRSRSNDNIFGSEIFNL